MVKTVKEIKKETSYLEAMVNIAERVVTVEITYLIYGGTVDQKVNTSYWQVMVDIQMARDRLGHALDVGGVHRRLLCGNGNARQGQLQVVQEVVLPTPVPSISDEDACKVFVIL